MAITFGASGATASGTTSVVAAYPAGITAGQLLLLPVTTKPQTVTVNTPAGWRQVASNTGGTGTFGADTGPTQVVLFARTADGAETGSVTVSISTATNQAAMGAIQRWTKTNAEWDLDAFVGAADTTNATSYSATGAALNCATGDVLWHMFAANGDLSGAVSARTLTLAGGTTGTVSGRQGSATANGNDLGIHTWDAPVSAGANGAPTATATFVGATSGAALFVRIREKAAVPPPSRVHLPQPSTRLRPPARGEVLIARAPTPAAAPGGPKAAQVFDRFAGSLGPVWTFGAHAAAPGEQLVLSVANGAAAFVQTDFAWDLRASSVHVEVAELPAFVGGTFEFQFLAAGETLTAHFSVSDGALSAFDGTASTALGAFDVTRHRWLRIREAAGTLYFEASPDGRVWATLDTATGFGALEWSAAQFALNGSYFGPDGATRDILIDGVNVTPLQREIEADAPSVWWRLDDSGSTFADEVGSLDAAITGDVLQEQAGLGGGTVNAGGMSARFVNSALAYAEVGPDAAFTSTQLSVELLFRQDSNNGNNRLIQSGADDSWHVINEGGLLKFTVFGLAEASVAWTPDTDVHHLVGTYDGAGTAILYLDGRQVGIEVGAGSGPPATPTEPLRIGQKPTGSTPSDGWNGYLDEVVIYPSALSAGRVLEHAIAAGIVGRPGREVLVYSDAAAAAARAARAVRRPVVVRTPAPAGGAQTADVALGSTFGASVSATRGAVADAALVEAFAITTSATRGTSGDVAIGGTLAVTAAATRGAVGDVALAEAFAISATATRGATADVAIASTFGLTASATVGPVGSVAIGETFAVTASATRGAVGDVSIASTFGLATSATRATTADVAASSTFALAAAATRGATAAASIASTFALTVSATVGPAGDVAIASTLAVTAAATRGAVADESIAATFAVTASATRDAPAAASIASTLQLAVAADVTVPLAGRAPIVATEAAVVRAQQARRPVRPAGLVVRAPQVSPPNVADATVSATFGVTAGAAVGVAGSVALTETLGLSVSAVRGTAGAVSVPLSFGLAADATVGPVGSVAIAEAFTVTATATRGAVASVAVAQAFAITTAATLAGVGSSTIASTFAISASATVTRAGGVAPIALSFALSVSAFVASGSIRAPLVTGGTVRAATIASGGDPTGTTITARSTTGATMTGG